MSCFICQAFGKNSPSNPQLAQECLATPLSRLHSINSRSRSPLLFFLTFFSPLPPSPFYPPPVPPFLPVCSSFQACQSGSGEKSLRMPNLTKCLLQTQRVAVEMGSDLPKLDLLTVSLCSFLVFLLSIVARCSSQCYFFHSALLRISFPPPLNLSGVFFAELLLQIWCKNGPK